MTTYSTTAAPSNSTATLFRAWASAVNTSATTVGLVDTAATGQIDLTTVAAPGAANTFQGFKVYRFADSLQGSYPVFIKIEFGSSNGSANNPALRITVGTAHDGSGNITGTQTTGTIQFGSQASSTTVCQCYASGDTGRWALAMFVENSTVNQQLAFLFGVERTKDATGADDSDGIVVTTCGYGSASNGNAIRSVVVPFSGGVPPADARWCIPHARPNSGGVSEHNSEVAMGLHVPFLGRAMRPVMNWGAVTSADAITYANTISPTVYGAAHTYISLGTAQAINQCYDGNSYLTSTAINGVRMLMRYE